MYYVESEQQLVFIPVLPVCLLRPRLTLTDFRINRVSSAPLETEGSHFFEPIKKLYDEPPAYSLYLSYLSLSLSLNRQKPARSDHPSDQKHFHFR